MNTSARARKHWRSWESHSLTRTRAGGNGINRLQPPLPTRPKRAGEAGAHSGIAASRQAVHAQRQRTLVGVGGLGGEDTKMTDSSCHPQRTLNLAVFLSRAKSPCQTVETPHTSEKHLIFSACSCPSVPIPIFSVDLTFYFFS